MLLGNIKQANILYVKQQDLRNIVSKLNDNNNIKLNQEKQAKLNEINNLTQQLKQKQELFDDAKKKSNIMQNVKQFSNLATRELDKELFGFNLLSSYANRAINLYKNPLDQENQDLYHAIKDIEKQIKQANKQLDKLHTKKNDARNRFKENDQNQDNFKKIFNFNDYNLDIQKLEIPFGYSKVTGVLIDAYLQLETDLILNLNNNLHNTNIDKINIDLENKDAINEQNLEKANGAINAVNTNLINKDINNQDDTNNFVTLVFAVAYEKINSITAIEINGEILKYELENYECNVKNQVNISYKKNKIKITIHLGEEDQDPNKSLEAYYGKNNCPAYKGLAYVVLENFPFKEYNAIRSIQFHVLKTNEYLKKEKINSKDQIESIVLVPGCGEFVYDTIVRTKTIKKEDNSTETIALNCCNPEGIANVLASLNHLAITLPHVKHISLVVCWFVRGEFANNKIDLSSIVNSSTESNRGVFPLVEYDDDENIVQHSTVWRVGNFTRNIKENTDIKANVVTKINNKVLFGGTPSDESLKNLIIELKKRGYSVMLNPMLMVDLQDKPWRGMITYSNENDIIRFFTGQSKNNPVAINKGYNNFIIHYAKLLGAYVDEFSLGSEFVGLSSSIAFAIKMKMLAQNVRKIIGSNVKILYGANYDEYHQKKNNRILNILHTEKCIDVIGIHAYPPITTAEQSDIITVKMIEDGWSSGVGYDYGYENNILQNYDTPDSAWKNFEFWQQNPNKINNVQDVISTLCNQQFEEDLKFEEELAALLSNEKIEQIGNWQANMKKVWLDEVGCASVNNSTNEPNIFIDESCVNGIKLPNNSNGNIDLDIQNTFINGTYNFWKDKENSVERVYWWCWEARPFPCWPYFKDIWSDTHLWPVGHYLNGKIPLFTIREIIIAIFELQAKKQNHKIKTLNYNKDCIYIEFENDFNVEQKDNSNIINFSTIYPKEFIKTLTIYGLTENIYGFILSCNSSINEVLSQLMLFSFFDIKITKDHISIIDNKVKMHYLSENKEMQLSQAALKYLEENKHSQDLLQDSYNFLLNKYNSNKEMQNSLSINNAEKIKIKQKIVTTARLIKDIYLSNFNLQKEIHIIDKFNIVENSLICISNIKDNLIQQVYISYFDLHLNYSKNIVKTNFTNNKINYFNLQIVTEKHKIKLAAEKIINNNNIESIFYNVLVGFEYINLHTSDLIILIIDNNPVIAKILSMKINNENIALKLTIEDLNSHKIIMQDNYRYNNHYNQQEKIEYLEYKTNNAIEDTVNNNIELIRLNGSKFRDVNECMNIFIHSKQSNMQKFSFILISYKLITKKQITNSINQHYSSSNFITSKEENNKDKDDSNVKNNDHSNIKDKHDESAKDDKDAKDGRDESTKDENTSKEYSKIKESIQKDKASASDELSKVSSINNDQVDALKIFIKNNKNHLKTILKQQYKSLDIVIDDISNISIINSFSVNLYSNIFGKLKSFENIPFENNMRYFIDTSSKFYITTSVKIKTIDHKYNENYINPIVLNNNLIKIGNEFMLYANCKLISEQNNEYEYEFCNLIRGMYDTYNFCNSHKIDEEFIDMQSIKNCIKVNRSENFAIMHYSKDHTNNLQNILNNIKIFPIIPFDDSIYLNLSLCQLQKKEYYTNNYLKFRESKYQDITKNKFIPSNKQYDKLILSWDILNLDDAFILENENVFLYEMQFILKNQDEEIELIYQDSSKLEWMKQGEIDVCNINSIKNSITFYLHCEFKQDFQFLCNNISAIEKIFIIYKYKKNNNNQIAKLKVYDHHK